MAWAILVSLCVLAAFPKSTARWRVALFEWVTHVFESELARRPLFWILVFACALAFSQAFVADVAWIAAIDFATYLEVLAAVALSGAALRVNSLRHAVVARVRDALNAIVRRVPNVQRRARTTRPRRRGVSKTRDDDAGAWAFA